MLQLLVQVESFFPSLLPSYGFQEQGVKNENTNIIQHHPFNFLKFPKNNATKICHLVNIFLKKLLFFTVNTFFNNSPYNPCMAYLLLHLLDFYVSKIIRYKILIPSILWAPHTPTDNPTPIHHQTPQVLNRWRFQQTTSFVLVRNYQPGPSQWPGARGQIRVGMDFRSNYKFGISSRKRSYNFLIKQYVYTYIIYL